MDLKLRYSDCSPVSSGAGRIMEVTGHGGRIPSPWSDALLPQPHLTGRDFSMGFGAIQWQQSWKETSEILGSWVVPGHTRGPHKQDWSLSSNFRVWDSASAGAKKEFWWFLNQAGKSAFKKTVKTKKIWESWLLEIINEASLKIVSENHINILQIFKCSETWAEQKSHVFSLGKLLRYKVRGARLIPPEIRLKTFGLIWKIV